jgi:hypothetical protein
MTGEITIPILYNFFPVNVISLELWADLCRVVENYNDLSRDIGILLASIENTKKASYKKI